MNKKNINIRMQPDLVAKLKKESELMGLSVNTFIRTLVYRYLWGDDNEQKK